MAVHSVGGGVGGGCKGVSTSVGDGCRCWQ